jgi:hypothetical protein
MLSLAGAVQTLRQDFQTPPVWRAGAVRVDAVPHPLSDPTFTWTAGYIWNHAAAGALAPRAPSARDFPAWTSNGQADADPNGDMLSRIGAARSPLSWSAHLILAARPMPADLAPTIADSDPRTYLSAAITSFPYSQRYGVFAMSAKLPRGAGLWPAFWLLPVDKSWPPEIDIMEVIGREPATVYTTLHLKGPIAPGQGTDTQRDLSADFHEYAVDWGPATITWYFDRQKVFSRPVSEELRKAFYIVINLGIGRPEQWGGAPDSETHFPAVMTVASVHVWQRAAYRDPAP